MKKLSLLLVAALSATFILDSCSVQKRYHRTGFNVNWKHTSVRMKKDKHPSASEELVNEEVLAVEKVAVKTNENIVSNYTYVQENTTASVNDEVVVANTDSRIDEVSLDNSNEKTEVNVKTSTLEVKIEKTKRNSVSIQNKLESKKLSHTKKGSDVPFVLLVILCFIIPPVAVGLATDWDLTPVLWNIVWCVICGVPGIIHALIHVTRNR